MMVNHLDYPLPGPASMADYRLAAVAPLLAPNIREQDLHSEDSFLSPVRIRINLYLIRSALDLRTNRSALLILMLMSARGNIIDYPTLLASLAPDAASELLGKKLVRVYIHEIRRRLKDIGQEDGLILHRLAGYSVTRGCIDAIELRMRAELRNW